MVTYNLNVADGIVNGSFGQVMGFQFNSDNSIVAIHVHLFNEKSGVESSKLFKSLENKYGKKVIVVQRYEDQYPLGKQNISASSTATAYQFPIKLASAVTAHRVQGQTFKPPQSVVVDLKNARNEAQVYVMLSRAQNLEQLFILDNLYVKNWKASVEAEGQLEKLKSRALNNQEVNTGFRIASLNTHSLREHIDDIKLIKSNISIFCIQETWLRPEDDDETYQIDNYNLDLNSIGLGKGVATYFGEEFQVVSKLNRQDLQITMLSSHKLDVLNIYRSQGNKTLMDDIFGLVNVLKKTVIIGDFNLDAHRNASIIEQLSLQGFRQMVKKSTHEQGGLIDHVYVNFKGVRVMQRSVYFSDHDLIIVELKENE